MQTTITVNGHKIKVTSNRNRNGCFARAEDNRGNVHKQNYMTLDPQVAADRAFANFVANFGDKHENHYKS